MSRLYCNYFVALTAFQNCSTAKKHEKTGIRLIQREKPRRKACRNNFDAGEKIAADNSNPEHLHL